MHLDKVCFVYVLTLRVPRVDDIDSLHITKVILNGLKLKFLQKTTATYVQPTTCSNPKNTGKMSFLVKKPTYTPLLSHYQ